MSEVNFLSRYAAFQISSKDAMEALGIDCLEALMLKTIHAGLHLPHEDHEGSVSNGAEILGSYINPRACNLIIMDAGPLIKLALADRLNLLLCFRHHVFIPDEVEFEAVEKFAWEGQTALSPDKLRLKSWVQKMTEEGRVSCPETLIGEIAKSKRQSGEYAPDKKNHRRNTGELAAHDFFNNSERWCQKGDPALLIMDDRPALESLRLHNLDVHVLSTYGMLVALEQEQLVNSVAEVWQAIERSMSMTELI